MFDLRTGESADGARIREKHQNCGIFFGKIELGLKASKVKVPKLRQIFGKIGLGNLRTMQKTLFRM
jgi:hypothetical protein